MTEHIQVTQYNNNVIVSTPGYQGPRGVQGPAGQGYAQLQGTQGVQGIIGSQGLQGNYGVQGAAGTSVNILGSYSTFQELQLDHPVGNNGDGYIIGTDLYVWESSQWLNAGHIVGPQGVQGPMGYGAQGSTGTQGFYGTQGPVGLPGVQGPQGLQGYLGTQGSYGTQGSAGLQGIQGLIGQNGIQGLTGIQGFDGLQGTNGLQGIQGTAGSYLNDTTTINLVYNSPTVLDSWLLRSCTTTEYTLQIKQAGKIRSSKIMIVNDENSIYYTEYSIISIGNDISGLLIDASTANISSNMFGRLSIQISDAQINNAQITLLKTTLV